MRAHACLRARKERDNQACEGKKRTGEIRHAL